MKKVIKIPLAIFVFIMVCGFFSLMGDKAEASDFNNWQDMYKCDELDYSSFYSYRAEGLIQDLYRNNFSELEKYNPWCIRRATVGALLDDNSRDVTNPDEYLLTFCPSGFNLALTDKGELPSRLVGCCISGFPYLYNGNTCCNKTNLEKKEQDKPNCYMGEDTDDVDDNYNTKYIYVPAITNQKIKENVTYFIDADKMHACPEEDCIMKNADSSEIKYPRVYPWDGHGELSCIRNGVRHGSGLVCVLGTLVRQDVYDLYITPVGEVVMNSCGQFPDAGEIETCLKCYAANPSNTYSSLGCIETTQNGLVIRMFQIGIGILSVIGILRIMQAAMLRQSADPTKIQESYDIIVSVIIGFVVLLGSIVILQFLGINILGLLPFDFLKP